MSRVLGSGVNQFLQNANPLNLHPEADAYLRAYSPVDPQVMEAEAEVVSSRPIPAAAQTHPVLARAAGDYIGERRLGLLPRAAVAAGSLMLAACDHPNDRVALKFVGELLSDYWDTLTFRNGVLFGASGWVLTGLVGVWVGLIVKFAYQGLRRR